MPTDTTHFLQDKNMVQFFFYNLSFGVFLVWVYDVPSHYRGLTEGLAWAAGIPV